MKIVNGNINNFGIITWRCPYYDDLIFLMPNDYNKIKWLNNKEFVINEEGYKDYIVSIDR